jgi:hypothetical protein
MTGGALNLGPSARQREDDELARRISLLQGRSCPSGMTGMAEPLYWPVA